MSILNITVQKVNKYQNSVIFYCPKWSHIGTICSKIQREFTVQIGKLSDWESIIDKAYGCWFINHTYFPYVWKNVANLMQLMFIISLKQSRTIKWKIIVPIWTPFKKYLIVFVNNTYVTVIKWNALTRWSYFIKFMWHSLYEIGTIIKKPTVT